MANPALKQIVISPTLLQVMQSVPIQELDAKLRSIYPDVFEEKTELPIEPKIRNFEGFLNRPVYKAKMSSEQAIRETREESTDWLNDL
ncbi:MAG: hypothetical protein V4543_14160 [Bacteroidota bacterium]